MIAEMCCRPSPESIQLQTQSDAECSDLLMYTLNVHCGAVYQRDLALYSSMLLPIPARKSSNTLPVSVSKGDKTNIHCKHIKHQM
jgi:hypothetical protein